MLPSKKSIIDVWNILYQDIAEQTDPCSYSQDNKWCNEKQDNVLPSIVRMKKSNESNIPIFISVQPSMLIKQSKSDTSEEDIKPHSQIHKQLQRCKQYPPSKDKTQPFILLIPLAINSGRLQRHFVTLFIACESKEHYHITVIDSNIKTVHYLIELIKTFLFFIYKTIRQLLKNEMKEADLENNCTITTKCIGTQGFTDTVNCGNFTIEFIKKIYEELQSEHYLIFDKENEISVQQIDQLCKQLKTVELSPLGNQNPAGTLNATTISMKKNDFDRDGYRRA